jgi:symplekin
MSHPDQALLWQDMTSMKLTVLRLMDTAPTSVRVCCVKFIQKVVQVQTPGVIADPRRPEQNETSIALVPRNHPLMPLPNMEAEASGLLDRLLSVFQENTGDPIMIDATLNCLAILIRSRPAVANKIISAILSFNPFKQATTTSMTPRMKVVVKSLERSTRAVLRNVLKHNPNSALAPKIDAYLQRLSQSRAAIFSETTSLKRSAPSEPTDGLDDAKRQRLTSPARFPHMPPPPNSFADLFTLTEDATLRQFDVKLLPVDIVNTISGVLLQHVNQQAMDEAIEAVKARYAHLQKLQQPTPVPLVPMAGPTGIDDEDDYDPEYELSADAHTTPATAQVLEELAQPAIDLGPFELPKPPPLTGAEVSILSQQAVNRVFDIVTTLDTTGDTVTRQKLGLNRLAASTNDRDAWVTMMTRLATRAPTDLEADDALKTEDKDHEPPTLATTIRQTLYMYILESFRPRLNIAISWLTEEWYADKLASPSSTPNYNHWTLKLMDSLLPYLDARDSKLLIRFLSEIPAINIDILDRVQSLARDPERVNMCMMGLQYLILMRPPVRELAIDTVERIFRDDDFMDARAQTRKVLAKWRPGALEERKAEPKAQEGVNGDTPGPATNGIQSREPAPMPAVKSETPSLDPRQQKMTPDNHAHPLAVTGDAA